MYQAAQKAKLKRQMKIRGVDYTFTRKALNKFKEPVGTQVESITLKGIFHNVTSYINVIVGDSTKKQAKFTPTILALYDDYIVKLVEMGDEVEFAGQNYKVNGVTNVENGNYAMDISLEVVSVG